MILADKIAEERKKLGLSQEELAEQLSVSRQAVSKWESAQSIPDLHKIIAMSELFSVSTDYLLKDEMEPQNFVPGESVSDSSMHRVSMEAANEFLAVMKAGSKTVALGVLLCILSPVLLIFLSGLSDAGIGISETAAVVVGLTALFLFAALAIFLFIGYGSKSGKFEYLKTEGFETAYGVSGLVKENKEAFEPTYTKCLTLGIILCVLSPLPLILSAVTGGTSGLIVSMTALLLCVVSIGVYLMVRVAMVKASYQILLQEGDFQVEKKKNSAFDSGVSGAYWCLVVAVYLAWSFLTSDWNFTWVVWPVAGLLFVPVTVIIKQLCGKNRK